MRLLEVENLRTYFKTEVGEARAVDGVSFTLEEGESLALVGESACGKSVTALSIMRLIEPPSGYHPSGVYVLRIPMCCRPMNRRSNVSGGTASP